MNTPRFLAIATLLLAAVCARAEGTRSWQQSKYDEFEKGTARGVAIARDGTLELAPAFKPVVTTPSSYIWSIKADRNGSVYLSARAYLSGDAGRQEHGHLRAAGIAGAGAGAGA